MSAAADRARSNARRSDRPASTPAASPSSRSAARGNRCTSSAASTKKRVSSPASDWRAAPVKSPTKLHVRRARWPAASVLARNLRLGPDQPQNRGGVMTQILDPTDERVPIRRSLARRTEVMAGTIGLLDINKARGDVMIERLRLRLSERLPGVEVKNYRKPTP